MNSLVSLAWCSRTGSGMSDADQAAAGKISLALSRLRSNNWEDRIRIPPTDFTAQMNKRMTLPISPFFQPATAYPRLARYSGPARFNPQEASTLLAMSQPSSVRDDGVPKPFCDSRLRADDFDKWCGDPISTV